jgi:hypothetical protein
MDELSSKDGLHMAVMMHNRLDHILIDVQLSTLQKEEHGTTLYPTKGMPHNYITTIDKGQMYAALQTN